MTVLFICFSVLAVIFAQGLTILEIRNRNRETSNQLRRLHEGLQAFVDFFSLPDNETGLTGFDTSLNNLAQVTAKSQANMIVASIRGNISGAVRGAESALEEQAFEDNPLQASIMTALPKKLSKNPLAQMALAKMVENMSKVPQTSNSGNGSKSEPVRFKI